MTFSSRELKIIGVAVTLAAAKDPYFLEMIVGVFPELSYLKDHENDRDPEWKKNAISTLRTRIDDVIKLLSDKIPKEPGLLSLTAFYWTSYVQTKGIRDPRNIMETKGPGMWEMFHSFAMSWDLNVDAAVAFLNKFAAQIPCGACKTHWRQINEELPPDMSSRNAFFSWSVEAHNAVNAKLNKPPFAVEEARMIYEKYVPKSVNKPSKWGPPLWRMFHERAASQVDLSNEIAWLEGEFRNQIPDSDIQQHWLAFLSVHKPDTSSRENYRDWSFGVHNLVNITLGKPTFDIEVARLRYPLINADP